VIDLPLSAFGLAPGDVLHDVQAFSFTGTTTLHLDYPVLRLIDATPANTVTVGTR
jgi:hypothetical protein